MSRAPVPEDAPGLLTRMGPRLRQWWVDLLAQFWLRPAVMSVAAVVLAELLVRSEGVIQLPGWLAGWVYAGGVSGARDVLGAIAGATIGVAGTTFSITVAAMTLASNQMGPRLLRNFTRDPGNQYALGALLATFAYALVALRSVHQADEGAFVPQLAVSVGLLMGFGCVAVLIWFIHHVATAISVDRVAALVADDLFAALEALPEAEPRPPVPPPPCPDEGAALRAEGRGGYLRVLDDAALADWAVRHGAVLRLDIRPGHFIFPGADLGRVWPEAVRERAGKALRDAMVLGVTRTAEQDLEAAVRHLVEIALRALSPGINDPFTAIAVLDRLGAALCLLAGRELPTGAVWREDRLRLAWPAIDYAGLVDAMFHALRQAAATQPAVTLRLLEVLGSVAGVERDAERQAVLRRHAALARDAALGAGADDSVREAVAIRFAAVQAGLRETSAPPRAAAA